MSTSILRRNSSKQSLQNLLRLTTQWSVEDEEEAARERRRRERQQQTSEDGDNEGSTSEGTCTQGDDNVEWKPAGPLENEEDEGFSDWSQRMEQKRQQELCLEANEETGETRAAQMGESETSNVREDREEPIVQVTPLEEEEDEGTSRYEATELNEERGSPEHCEQEAQNISSNQWETRDSPVHNEKVENGHECRYMPTEREEVDETSYSTYSQENRDTEILRDHWAADEQANRRLSVSSDGESEGSITTTVKITERTECLNRSIEKSNSIKKSEPLLPISKIDDRLEQYTHAIEVSGKQQKLIRTPSLELLTPTDAVSVKKNRWEAGDVATASKPSPCKDTEGINIGVSDMISQWGKGKSEVDAPQSPTRPTEVRPGDVLSKKNLWEQSGKTEQSSKNLGASKKYKFITTGHGKYEKVLIEDP
ncbi:hypothetical protein GDO86_008741 [Hymenochirus boettgeri]|uniref:Lymphocyte-specific protein 1 n=1 Tax=Hymenochirus boettgeri TaxID=247094 RepID=A0A8T2J1L8_9PIPI|nr:hypothetical protein GDO86_008741 [Hymenochirus boettgeri]